MASNVIEWPAIVGPSYRYQSYPIDCQECINFEPVKVNSEASRSRKMLIGTPGRRRVRFRLDGAVYQSLPSDGKFVRGFHRCQTGFNNFTTPALVAVCGTDVWEISRPDKDLVCDIRKVGTIPDGGRVSIADGGGDHGSKAPPILLIGDGTTYYYSEMDYSGFTSLGSGAPNYPTDLAFLDRRIYSCGPDNSNSANTQNTSHIYWSAINDPSTWDGSCISSQVYGSPVLAIEAAGNSLWILGGDYFEVWQTSSSVIVPIKRVSGGQNGVGTSSGKSVASIGGEVFFVGGGPSGHCGIFRGNGTKIDNVATDAMKDELSRYSTLEDATGFCYSDEGRPYYVVTFPSEDVTWVYNIKDECWHRRAKRDERNEFHHWDVAYCEFNWGMNFVASIDSPDIFVIDRDCYTDDGKRIVRERRCPHIVDGDSVMVHGSLSIGVETGVGLVTSPNKEDMEPQIMLSWFDSSRGGSRGYSREFWRSVGRAGQSGTRVKWYGLGSSRDRVYVLRVSAAVRWCIYDAFIGVSKGAGGL